MKNNNFKILRIITVTFICFIVFALLFVKNSDIFSGVDISDDSAISDDFVEIIDVGQGDSILITSNGYSALIDTGVSDSSNNICSVLQDNNVDFLDVLLITHLDSDHIGGAERVIEVYKPKNLILPEISVKSEGISSAYLAINKVKSYGGEVYTAVQGMNFKIGEFDLTVLAHLTDLDNENNRSVITVAEINDKRFLFTGDIESKGEKLLLKEGLDLKCDVLKVAHHGSNSSSTEEFLKETKPRYAAISVGFDNRYGHPHDKVLSALEYYSSRIYRTDLDGNIIFYVKNGEITVKTSK